MKDVDTLLREQKIILPEPAQPLAHYRPFIQSGPWLIISGQLPLDEKGVLPPHFCGKIGLTIDEDQGYLAARQCAINILAQAKSALGSLGRIEQCLRLGGFINATEDYTAHAKIMNGASDLIAGLWGEAGRHARSTLGVASLPLNASVEIEALFAVRQ
jgi:enamine deaminase RidA (YjgF/YER057c/UK114 family)